MNVKGKSEVTQSCPTFSDLMHCSLPGSSIHGTFQARVLEWGAIAFSGVRPLHFCRAVGFNPWVGKIPLEKEMAAHSSTLAWEIPWTEEPRGLLFMGSLSN